MKLSVMVTAVRETSRAKSELFKNKTKHDNKW